jgi:hypothetical protein
MGIFRIIRIKPRVRKKVSAAIKGISTIGFRVVKLSLNPKKPLSKDSKIIM